MILTLFYFILQLLRQILVLGAKSGDERNVKMPPPEVELGRPTGLVHGKTEYTSPPQVARGWIMLHKV
jgi:hypothetical protein